MNRAAVGGLRAALGAVVAVAVMAAPTDAQSFRGWIGSSVHMIEARPVGADTVPRGAVQDDGQGGFLYEGYEVTCGAQFCTGLLPLDERRMLAVTQDAGLTWWGLGVEGLSVTALVRVRTDAGDDIAWPRYDDRFDAQLAYAQLARSSVRVRAGRQEIRSGLGFAGFDGLSGSYDRRRVRLEAYGGRSLARGLRQPTNEAVRSLRDFFVDKGVYLFGGAATIREPGVSITARYQREILSDRSGLESERGSVDVSTTMPRARVRASVDYDFAFDRVGKAELTVSAPFRDGTWLVELGGRRYVPYFQLSTIWGFFEPVSYHEVVGRVGWSPDATLGLWVGGGFRSYEDTQTPLVLQPLEDKGRRLDLGGRWAPFAGWSLDAGYQMEWGGGAFLSGADASLRRQATERIGAAVSISTFQQFEEYRLGQGRAFGAGGSVDVSVTNRLFVLGGFSVIRHRDGGTVYTSPWNQTRAWTSLRWSLGEDPGLANRERIR